jgi:hypothetical protein
MTRQQKREAVASVTEMSKPHFGLKGIKFEFEAKFGRFERGGDLCDYCEQGSNLCGCCEGDGSHYCDDCESTGDVPCTHCDGEGYHRDDDNPEADRNECSYCDGTGRETCENCAGDGRYECGDCEGEGREVCSECDGDWGGQEGIENPFVDEVYCHDWILERLAEHGLAERSDEGYRPEQHREPIARQWKPKYPITYSKVYRDGTVDTEWTITLLLDDPKNVLIAPKLIEVWNALGEEINRICGTETDVSNAGMHIALLQGNGAVYPARTEQKHFKRFENFQKSMILLMPALYFLGSTNEHSRALSYRAPKISCPEMGIGEKYSAIHYRSASLEFRVFDTCYETPDAVLDNVVVMANCLKYWRKNYRRNYLDKITTRIAFGKDNGNELKRFYITSEHIDLLNRGLKLIKPSYYTISEVKKQRKFTVTKRQTNNVLAEVKKQAEIEYKEYEKRFSWELVMTRHNYIRRYAEERMFNIDHRTNPVDAPEQELPELEKRAEDEAKRKALEKMSCDIFTERKVKDFNEHGIGDYRLAVEGSM